jgi:adenylate cyclase
LDLNRNIKYYFGGTMEIERKFRIKQMPENLEQYEKKEIEQGYLCSTPTVRIRKSNEKFILTYKSRIGMEDKPNEVALTCEEVELPLTKEAYDHLKEKIDHHLITKTRYLIPINDGLTVELDVFHGNLKGLLFAEVEFVSEEAAAKFEKPDWLGDEVSFDHRYKNNYLSKAASLEEIDYNEVYGFI